MKLKPGKLKTDTDRHPIRIKRAIDKDNPTMTKKAKVRAPKAPAAKGQASKGGRPSSYRDEYAEQAEKLCKLGATDADLADFFEVDLKTIQRWQGRHEAFSLALKMGKDQADARVERSLYHRAVGYTFDSVKIFQHQGQPVVVPYREHVPPDTTAQIFWLKNRRRDAWRDRQDHDHSHVLSVSDEFESFIRSLAGGQAVPQPLLEAQTIA